MSKQDEIDEMRETARRMAREAEAQGVAAGYSVIDVSDPRIRETLAEQAKCYCIIAKETFSPPEMLDQAMPMFELLRETDNYREQRRQWCAVAKKAAEKRGETLSDEVVIAAFDDRVKVSVIAGYAATLLAVGRLPFRAPTETAKKLRDLSERIEVLDRLRQESN